MAFYMPVEADDDGNTTGDRLNKGDEVFTVGIP